MGFSRNNPGAANFFDWWGVLVGALGLLGLATGLVLFRIAIRNESEKRDDGSLCADADVMGYFVTKKKNTGWGGIWCGNWPLAEIPTLPTIGGLFQAGDSLLYTSAALDYILPGHDKISWRRLYSAVFDEVVKDQGRVGAIEAASPRLKGFLEKAKSAAKPTGGNCLSQALKNPLKPEVESFPPDLESRQMSAFDPRIGTERTLLYETNKKRPFLLVSCVRQLDIYKDSNRSTGLQTKLACGFQNLRKLWLFNSQPCIEVSQAELAELSLVLGMRLYIKTSGRSPHIHGFGIFGTILDGFIQDGSWRINLLHCNRDVRDGAAKGSGFSTLFAKYIACGCLPFGQKEGWIQYIQFGPQVDSAVRLGDSIQNVRSETKSEEELEGKRYLHQLSTIGGFSSWNAQRPRYNPHPFSNETPESMPCGVLRDFARPDNAVGKAIKYNKIYASWSRAITNVAFGGLVPQAAPGLAEAIKFTALGQIVLAGRLSAEERLERIINAIHMYHQDDHLFGGFVAYRLKIATKYTTFAPLHWDNRSAAATFGRYMTLFEYFVARFNVEDTILHLPGEEHEDYRTRVEEKREKIDSIDRSPSLRREIVFERCAQAMQQAHQDAVKFLIGPRHSASETLLNPILQRVKSMPTKPGRMFRPTLDECVNLAMAIIAVWADRVPRIVVRVSRNAQIPVEDVWDSSSEVDFDVECSSVQDHEEREHVRLLSLSRMPHHAGVYHAPPLEDLPCVAALG